MKINAYAVKDIKADRFNYPFFTMTHAEAMRAFGSNVQRKESLFNKHPEDFQLFYVGSFEDALGLLECEHQPVYLAKALDYITLAEGGLNDAAVIYNGKQ